MTAYPKGIHAETIAYLRQVTDAEKRIQGYYDRIGKYRNSAMSATSRIDAINSGGTSARSKLEEGIVAAIDLERELQQKIAEQSDLVAKVTSEIESVKNIRHRDLLSLRYLNGWSWKRIADWMGFAEERGVHKLHGRALESFEQVWQR